MRWPLVLVSVLVWSGSAPAQSVIAARSGLVNYSEGAVFIDNHLIAQKPGQYATLHEGSDLLTQDGRAEILLTPEVYLRIGVNGGVRMISNDLADTRVQVLSGSAILESGNAAAGPGVTLTACGSTIKVENPARLRIDSNPPQLRVERGEVTVESNGQVTRVRADQVMGLAGESVVRRMTAGVDDALDEWSLQRNRLIYLSLANDKNVLDPGTADPAPSDADLNAWLGYIPTAGVLPLTGSYAAIGVPGYGYYSPWNTLAFYGPVYGAYVMGYPGLGYLGAGYGFGGGYGMSIYRSVPGYRFTPVYPGTIGTGAIGTFSPRPIGGIRIGIGVPGSGISMPSRPVMAPRPVMVHPVIRR